MIPLLGDLCEAHVELVAALPREPILLCSGGGSSEVARALYGLLVTRPRPVVALGEVGSSALGVLALGQRGYRIALPWTRFMLHRPYSPSEGEFGIGDLRVQHEELVQFQTDLLDALLTGTGIDWSEDLEAFDRWFGAEIALRKGLVDVVDPDGELLDRLFDPPEPPFDPEHGEGEREDLDE